ncbi:hypothetical protein ACWODG_07660 [Enterococcus italicus]
MYFKNQYGTIVKTETGIIADAVEKTTTIEVKHCDNMVERIDYLYENAVAELKLYTMMQELEF